MYVVSNWVKGNVGNLSFGDCKEIIWNVIKESIFVLIVEQANSFPKPCIWSSTWLTLLGFFILELIYFNHLSAKGFSFWGQVLFLNCRNFNIALSPLRSETLPDTTCSAPWMSFCLYFSLFCILFRIWLFYAVLENNSIFI